MSRTIRLNVEYLPDKVFLATTDAEGGFLVEAETMPLLLEYADDMARICIEYREGKAFAGELNFEVHEVPYVQAA